MNKTDVINIIKEKLQILVNFYSTKNYKEVISKGLPLLKKNPQLNVLTNLVSLSYHNLGEHDKALNYLNKAFQVNSNDKSVLNNLGLIYTSIEKYEEAEEYLTRALKLHSDYIPAKINLANLKLKLNNATESINILEKILIKDKNNYDANFTLGNAYQQAGEFKKAEECFNKCLLLDKTKTIADKSLSLIIKYNKDSKHLKHMKEKINLKKTFDMESLSHLNFAIGKAYEDIGKYKEAFYHLDRGNKIKKTLIKYNFLEEKKLFINIKKLFSHFTYENHIDNDDNKIFVVGMTRSGTSLIEQILSSHNNIYGAGELNYIQNIASQHFMKNEIDFTESNINDYKEDIFFKSKIYYNNNLKRFKTNKKFIVDKAPLNFKWIGLILKLFPGCKIIHCTRDPMDICWSNYKNWFASKKLYFSYDLENLGNYYNCYKDLMSFWKINFKNKIFDIQYENLITNSEDKIKELIKFCNVKWDSNCLNFHKNKKVVATASLAQVRQPIYKSSVKQWENYKNELLLLKKIIN
tara:strand:+ start:499 stop:2064 length:1566 start_codon:yes stop_codon:yes gene_type:complete